MHTRATGRRSSSPVPAHGQASGAGRAAFAAPEARQPAEPPDYDTWLHNAEAFGHHFAELPAASSQPVQRQPDEGEDASPYALPAGVSLNALRSPSGPEPIQGFGIPDFLKRLGRGIGRGIGGLASGALSLASSLFGRGGDNNLAAPAAGQQRLLAQDAPGPEPDAPPAEELALLSAPSSEVDSGGSDAESDDGVGIGSLGPPRAEPAAIVEPPSFEELQRQREAAERAFRRGQRGGPGPSSVSASSPVLSAQEEASIRARARDNSDQLSGHGRQAHGRKGRSRPDSQVASNTSRSRRKAEERTVAAATSRAKREKEDKKDK